MMIHVLPSLSCHRLSLPLPLPLLPPPSTSPLPPSPYPSPSVSLPLPLPLSLSNRPVVALLEVDVYRVDPKQRATVMKEVILSLGPPDPTIVISEREEGVSVPVPQLLDALRPYGQVVLVR